VNDDDLPQFLADRYDEAEALARAWQSPPWGDDATSWKVVGRREPRYDNGRSETLTAIDVSGRPVNFAEAIQVRWDSNGERSAYIAANDPKHRLADIKLKRAILAEHAREPVYKPETLALYPDRPEMAEMATCRRCHELDEDAEIDEDRCGDLEWPCANVRQLGTEFTEHPGYRPEWAP
jgi:Family of unknown function (DUF6221)